MIGITVFSKTMIRFSTLEHFWVKKVVSVRGVPAYTQSTQLRTLIFECPKNKNVLNREKLQ